MYLFIQWLFEGLLCTRHTKFQLPWSSHSWWQEALLLGGPKGSGSFWVWREMLVCLRMYGNARDTRSLMFVDTLRDENTYFQTTFEQNPDVPTNTCSLWCSTLRPLWEPWTCGGRLEHTSCSALRTYVGPKARGCRSSIWCPVSWPCCMAVAANRLGLGLNVFETHPSFTPVNCFCHTDSLINRAVNGMAEVSPG